MINKQCELCGDYYLSEPANKRKFCSLLCSGLTRKREPTHYDWVWYWKVQNKPLEEKHHDRWLRINEKFHEQVYTFNKRLQYERNN